MKKTLILFFTSMQCVLGCQSNHTLSSASADDFTMVKASYEEWVSGFKGGGRGVEYYFLAKINTAKSLAFDSAYISGKSYPLFVTKERQFVSDEPITFLAGDTVTLRVSHFIKDQQEEQLVAPPVNYSGDALISYRSGKESRYFTVSKLEKLPTVERQ